jgi:hypothetical protein
VKQDNQFQVKSLSASEYVLALHEPEDRVAVVLVNRRRGQSLQRIASAETVTAPDFQKWLSDQNRSGSDVFVGMNPLKDGATSRTKESISEIRHVYLDLDDDAKAALANVRDSLDVPSPNFVLDTSPAKHQVVWKIEGVDLEQAESLLHALANHFGGDTAATDATRVLRMPGFLNHKYPQEPEFLVRAHHESNCVYTLRDFTIRDDSPDFDRSVGDSSRAAPSVPPGHKSQSEVDWAYAKRALARGDSPDEVMRRIADYRAHDKPDPEYYARRTVMKALAELEFIKPGVDEPRTTDARVESKRV